MFQKTGTLLTAVLLGLTATVATTGPAVAAPADGGDHTLSVGRLILTPTDRGYQGSVSVTITNTGSATDYFHYKLREPVPGAFQSDDLNCDMFDMRVEQNRRVFNCALTDNWVDLAPGQSIQNVLDFHVLTDPRQYPMIMSGGWVEAYSTNGGLVASTSVNALFRSTTGSLIRPRPYVQDAQPDASIRLNGPVTEFPDGEGNLRVPVTIRYDGDAPHNSFQVQASSLPAGSVLRHTDPGSPVGSGGALVPVPGMRLMPGEEYSFALVISPPTDPADATELIDIQVTTDWYPTTPDVDPSDNVVRTALTVGANG
ncbi:hypothetical protein [Micromonospora chokoriensis]|uniref:Uncharacterized protein n=1 Tax=Micromonospora chokoriensis TaxID=356851 RepID=A0A1C4VWB1_9ACTN|nr:hypothetical protein [Micromonospora chokoriensis]SCE88304.1 hypothetical protein GA0070612_1865 [Micromonospora chokoriensis]